MFGYTGMTRAKFALLLGGILALALFTVAVYHAPGLWLQVRLALLRDQAVKAAARHDPAQTLDALRQADALAPADLPTIRLAIRLLDPSDSDDELSWRSSLADLDPDDLANLMEIARLAPDLDQVQLGQRAIAALRPHRAADADFLHLAAIYSARGGDHPAATRDAAAAFALRPDSDDLRVHLAELLAVDPAPEPRARSRELLEPLASRDGPHQTRALRTLRDLARQAGDRPRAATLSARVLALPEPTLPDRLAHMDLLDPGDESDGRDTLDAIRKQALDSPNGLLQLADWSIARGRAQELLAWLDSLPDSRTRTLAAQIALARALLATGAWERIVDLFSDHSWAEHDALRLAALARARRKIQPFSTLDWEAPWRDAMVKAIADPGDARDLALLLALWPDWKAERADLLWKIDQMLPPLSSWALDQLRSLYRETGNTSGLQRVSRRLTELLPSSDAALNNALYYTLLLELDIFRSATLAAQLHERAPADPIIASTHALALYRLKKTAKALEILSRCPADILRQPAVAALHAAILTDLGNLDAANRVLRDATANNLLPEEFALAEHAQKRISRLAASFQGARTNSPAPTPSAVER